MVWRPFSQVSVSAGNLSNLGKIQIVGRLTDQFDNDVNTAGHRVDFTVFNVVGATGTIKCRTKKVFRIQIRFQGSEIRRG